MSKKAKQITEDDCLLNLVRYVTQDICYNDHDRETSHNVSVSLVYCSLHYVASI